MSLYESVFIARQDISGTQAEALIETFSAIVTEQGGQVTKKEYWGLKSLAFRIKKNRKGHYVLLNIDAPSAALLEMERNMRLNEDVLRYMSIRVDELEEGPSAVLQGRGERSDRGDRGDRGGRHREGGYDDGGERRPRGGFEAREPRPSFDGAEPRPTTDEGSAE